MAEDTPGQAEVEPGIDAERVVVRYVNDDDVDAIAKHLLLCFGDWPPFEIDCSVQDHVAWKMSVNAKSRGEQIVATLEDDDQFIVSLTIRVRRPGWVRGEPRTLIDANDLSVHPEWRLININRTRRAFRVEHGQNDYDLNVHWLAHHPATRKSGLRHATLGNRVLVLWKPASLRSLVTVPYRTAGWRQLSRALSAAVRGLFRRRRGGRFAGAVVDLERFDDRTDAVWEAAKPDFEFAFERTQDYLNWRYADPRAGQFVIRAAVEGDEVIGYIVLKPHRDPAEIVDLLVRPGRLDAVEALVADAVARVRANGRRDVHCWLPGRHPYADTVRQLGFLDSGRDPSLRYDAGLMTQEELAFLQDPELAVHVTQGDSDFV